MRTMLVLLSLISLNAFSQDLPPSIVWPRVYSTGSGATVEAWNTNRTPVMCSGSVYMRLESGKSDSEHVSMYIPAMGFGSQRVYARDFNDRVRSVNHSIWCN